MLENVFLLDFLALQKENINSLSLPLQMQKLSKMAGHSNSVSNSH